MLHAGRGNVNPAVESSGVSMELKSVKPNAQGNAFVSIVKEMPDAEADSHGTSDSIGHFASTTTMHGVSFYYNSTSKPMKVFWIFLLVGKETRMLLYNKRNHTYSTPTLQSFQPWLLC